MPVRTALLALTVLIFGSGFAAAEAETTPPTEALGIALEGYPYPYPVAFFERTVQGEDVRMAYMDVAPSSDSPRSTVMLLHGKNFFGAYWKSTIAALSDAGYRVVVPDQVGFGKSSKPDIQYSFHLLASETKALLDSLGVERTTVVGHSMGGMLATRFALMYPETTERLVLENPIGLEDYLRIVPYAPVEAVYKGLLGATYEGIKSYHQRYYVEWKPAFEDYVQVHYRWTLSGAYPRLAWNSALTADMIFTQPVVHEFPDVAVPTLLVIGQEDRTRPGANRVPPEVRETMGDYPVLGKKAAEAIPGSRLVELENVGHIPHLEVPERLHEILLGFLEGK
ncbi:MAG: alpha/beta hydrolase [Rhodospirillaceae bacterium]|nr:alpha/beta hydrolase [Rhodospirillaceae bacterium]|tara:strand:- start:214 stop:1227 length:1014 start_codon:yes stop_codon:yes gene_type:complete